MTHPIIGATLAARDCLKSVADANPTFMTAPEKAQALTELVSAEAQLVELRMRVLSAADDVAESAGARDPAAWLAHQTRVRPEDARAEQSLAVGLDRRHPVLATAMREGEVNPAQARVIATTLGRLIDLPHPVGEEVLALAEARLVADAADFRPKELGRLGRHILEVVAPEVAEAAEARRLAQLESDAAAASRLVLRRQGDGTTRISGRLPDAVVTRLATYLEAFASPRQQGADSDSSGQDPVTRLPYPRRLGEAFCHFLEAIDPTRLPLHGGDATTVIVTIDLSALRAELGTAHLIGAGGVPGDDLIDDRITAAQARRLACTARILPAVLGGESQPLDLGGRDDSSALPNARRCCCATRPVVERAATSPGPGPKPTTSHPGPAAVSPTSTTPSCSAATTTIGSTTPATASSASPTATSDSTDADRPAGQCGRRLGRLDRSHCA